MPNFTVDQNRTIMDITDFIRSICGGLDYMSHAHHHYGARACGALWHRGSRPVAMTANTYHVHDNLHIHGYRYSRDVPALPGGVVGAVGKPSGIGAALLCTYCYHQPTHHMLMTTYTAMAPDGQPTCFDFHCLVHRTSHVHDDQHNHGDHHYHDNSYNTCPQRPSQPWFTSPGLRSDGTIFFNLFLVTGSKVMFCHFRQKTGLI